ncbi:MAG: FAD:protein FMN transferase [Ruminococcaceae bacterium]|nr:FAD:protein FMN transferase [Oscillospiraceae bacterium]
MKRILAFIIMIFSVFSFSSCSDFTRQVTRQSFALDTVINITTDEKDQGKIGEAFSLCNEYEKVFSRTDSESELYLLNNGQGELTEDIENVLEFSIEMARLTNGAFDVTVAPLVDLWNVKERKAPPSGDEIEIAQSKVGYEAISISPLSFNGKSVDLGAVAKGYIADKIADFFKSNGVENAIIDLGGNVVLIGEYSVGIRSPFNPDEIFATITLKDKSAVTSGAYQRYFEYEGKRYHHIIDPRTGYPSDSGIASVTVISPSSMQADALSTSIFILGKDAISLCDKFPDTDALIIMENGDVITTENFEKKYQLKK